MNIEDVKDRKRAWARSLGGEQGKAWLDFYSRWFATEEFLQHGRALKLWTEE